MKIIGILNRRPDRTSSLAIPSEPELLAPKSWHVFIDPTKAVASFCDIDRFPLIRYAVPLVRKTSCWNVQHVFKSWLGRLTERSQLVAVQQFKVIRPHEDYCRNPFDAPYKGRVLANPPCAVEGGQVEPP